MARRRDHSVIIPRPSEARKIITPPRLINEHKRIIRTYGEITEAKLVRWLGDECVDSMKLCSSGLAVPMPIIGVPAVMYKGEVVPMLTPMWAGGEVDGHQRVQGMAGFSSLSDLIAEATVNGKSQDLMYSKNGIAAAAVANSQTLWPQGALPVAGAAPAAPAAGTVPTNATAGALQQVNPTGGDTMHVTTWTGLASAAVGSLMLYDYLFGTTTAANPGTGAISVTGVQNRYTGASGTVTYPAGCFISNWVTVVLPATGHNITYTYTDQDNNASASSGANVGVASAAVGRTDFAAPQWCSTLASGDTGVRQITAITFSVSPATGQVAHYIGHPMCILPMPAIGVGFVLDGINSAFNLHAVQDNACLTLMEFFKSATGANSYSGHIKVVAG